MRFLLRLMSMVGLVLTTFSGNPALADPMRPFTLPAAASAASGAPGASGGPAPVVVRNASEPVNARPAGDLLAIRQDSQGRFQALVGERWLAVGERIEQSTVSAIHANAIEFTRGKARATVHLLTPLVASRADAGSVVAEGSGHNSPGKEVAPTTPKHATTAMAHRGKP